VISQTAEYALRAVVWLASQTDRPVYSTSAIAAATRVPPGYLSKVLQALSRSGLVTSQPGRKGGITLSRRPEELTVLDVINAVDPLPQIRSCPLGIADHGANLCPLHRRLRDAVGIVNDALGRTTIAELLAETERSRPFCES
jgi:Rrf2 family protein